ncbi:DUF58 domain-containing protein [Streptomyces sp. NRRL F-5123]|uniref:DUF58 domain-containing protein n=1 Tax=Streptomyces sp. NRRL F-5123 TaxID=1463856 RepID=UPI0004E1DB99|nr:DUF58 domain-containing protein [Streptomyces sp. NRRL F-5123]
MTAGRRPAAARARRGLTPTGRWVCGAGAVAGVLGAGGQVRALFGAGLAATCAVLAAWALTRLARRPGVSRAVPGVTELKRGERVTLRYVPSGRAGGTPVVRQELRDGGGRTLAVAARGWTGTSPVLPRGVWELGPAVAEYEDVLGLARTRTAPSEPGGSLLVRPCPPAAPVPWVARAVAAHASGAARLDTDAAFEIHGLRGYVPGDDLRLVDWRSSLRTGSFQLRERRDAGSARAVVLLDTAAEEGAAFETAVDCAAAVALSVLRLSRSVTLVGVAPGPCRVEPAPTAPGTVLDLLTRVRARPGGSNAALSRYAAGLPGGALAVLATTCDPARRRPVLSALGARHAAVVCLHAVPPGGPARTPPQAPGFHVLRVAGPADLAASPDGR